MQTLLPAQSTNETARWLRFLSRWALLTALMILALLSVELGGIGFSPADSALGAEYSEVLQAVRVPGMYRLAMLFDASGWALMGGGLLALAFILKGLMPIRALFVAACGVGSLTGFVGGAMRFVAIGDLAARYAMAVPAQQAALLPTVLAIWETIHALFVAGDLLVGAAYLLVASALWQIIPIPRWLVGWSALAGALSLLLGITSAVGAFSVPLLLLTVVVGIGGLHAAMAIAFWRPSAALVNSIASA